MFAYVHYPEESDPRAAPLLDVPVPRGTGLRAQLAAKRAARAIARQGVTEAVFPGEYPYRAAFARAGVRATDVTALRRAMTAELTTAALENMALPPRRATVCFAARYASAEVCGAVLETAARVRYVALAMDGAEALADTLRRTLGVAPHAPGTAELWVCFDETAAAQAALPLWDDGYEVSFALDGAPIAEPLLAALRRMGTAGEITVLSASPVREG